MLRKVCNLGVVLATALFLSVQTAYGGIITFDLGDFTPNSVSYNGSSTTFWGNGPNTAERVILNSALGLSRTEFYGPGGISITGTRMSSNSGWGAAYGLTPGSVGLGEGLVVDLATGQIHQVGHLGSINQSPAFGVSNSGVATGDADGARKAYTWSQTNGIQGLSSPDAAIGRAISDGGTRQAGFALNGIGTAQAAQWINGGFSFLDDPFLIESFANGIAPDGQNSAGYVSRFNFANFETEQLLAGWDSTGSLSLFSDVLGNDAFGSWNSLTNGFYGGSFNDVGLVFDPLDGYVRSFDDWALSKHGLTFGSPTRSVNDVFWDGSDYHFALEGSGRYVRAPDGAAAVPEPASWMLFSMGILIVGIGAGWKRRAELWSKLTIWTRKVRPNFVMRILLTVLSLGLLSDYAQAGPIFVDLGSENDVVGVTRLGDGTALLVGNTFNTTTQTNEAVLFTVSSDGSTVSSTTLGSLGGDTFATGISHNGQFISGYSVSPLSQGLGEGAVWEVENPGVAQGVGFLGSFNQSPAFHVSNDGVAAGHADGARDAFTWSQNGGIQAIPDQPTLAAAAAISDAGNVVVGLAQNGVGTTQAAVWNDGAFSFLEDPFQVSSLAVDVSSDGDFVGGFVSFFDFTVFETVQQAAVWENGVLTLLTDENGDPFEGMVNGVSSNGYAVGESELGGFIWHESFGGVRLFEEWSLTEHGLTFPTPISAVNDIYFDGTDLNFALDGSAYYAQTPAQSTAVPEPSSLALCLIAGGCFALFHFRRRRNAPPVPRG